MSVSLEDMEEAPDSTMMKIMVDRPAFDQDQLDVAYGRIKPPIQTTQQKLSNCCRSKSKYCTPKYILKELLAFVPFIETLRTYKWKEHVFLDMLAGVSVGMVHISQGMGFALLAAVAPVYGLYSSFWQVLLYMIFGGCRHLSIGTMAVVSLIVGPVVEREAALWRTSQADIYHNTTVASIIPYNNSLESLVPFTVNGSGSLPPKEQEGLTEEDMFRSSVACGVSLISGLTMLCMGILRLGGLTTFMPTSFIGGFTTAAAFHIATTQLKFLLNVPVTRYGGVFNLPRSIIAIVKAIPLTNIPDLIVTIITFSFLVFIKEFINVKYKKKLKIPVPADMIVVIAATIISFAAKFHDRWQVKIIGYIPPGIPAPQMPNLDRASTYVIDGMVAGVTSFAISISMVEILTKKHRYSYSPNKELVAYGLTYGVSSFFHCFVGAGAPPRCFVMELNGGKTQVASAFTATLLLLVLVAIAPVFKFLPNASLACIIIVALFPLFKQFKEVPSLWKLSKPDLLIWIVTFVVSVVFDVSISLGVGILVAIIVSVLPSLSSKGYIYDQMGHADLYVPTKQFSKKSSESVRENELVVFRFDSTLYYLTVKRFMKELADATFDPVILSAMEESSERDNKSNKETEDKNMMEMKENGNVSNRGTGSPLLAKENSQKIKTIVLDCSPITYIDLMGLNTLEYVVKEYSSVGVDLVMANCNPRFLEKLEDAGMTSTPQQKGINIYPTIQDAVAVLSAK